MAFDGGPSDFEVNVEKWKERKFPRGSRARATFEHLCLLGCDPRGLLSFLTLAVFNSEFRNSIYENYGVSQSALVKLPARLENISRELETVNLLLGSYLRAFFVENPVLSDQVRSRWHQKAVIYQGTPKVLRLLAIDLRAANTRLAKCVGPRRYDTFRRAVLDLLRYVDTCTKNPHYQEVADLLDHLHSADKEVLQRLTRLVPKLGQTGITKKDGGLKLLTSADALRALYHHSAKYGFHKPERSKSKRLPSV